ncbi:MAG: pantetheine-phosphate adenylyltransferase [Verrucomicrobiota bacterium]
MKRAIYPGTFDPITYGHIDVLKRACRIFDEVIIAVVANRQKGPLFTPEERVGLIAENIGNIPNARLETFDGLAVDYARSKGAVALVRGMRAVSDFDYEFQMAQMNRHLDEELETIFLMPSPEYFFTSSTLVKQVFKYTDRDTRFVPPNVHAALKKRYNIT